MINRFFFLFLAFALLSVRVNVSTASSGFITHTQPTPIELKPVSFSDLNNSYQTASVCFLGYGDCGGDVGFKSGDDYNVDTANQCKNEGYKTAAQLGCSSVQKIDGSCPYNTAYGKKCVCIDNLVACPAGSAGAGEACGGKYVSCNCASDLVTCASNKIGSGASCGGKYESCVCKLEYQYTTSNCTSPRSVGGASCDGKYTTCICPTGVSAEAYGCKEYYPSPCGSICKIAYSDNCHNRSDNNNPTYGCMKWWDDCSSKCEKTYTDNCRNRTAVSDPYGCKTYWPDCSSKCQTAYADNCRNRTAVSEPYGCKTYWPDCSSKCQTAYVDNCRNRTGVSTPHGCAKSFADCSSKCEVAYGPACKIGDIYYNDGTCVAAKYHTADKTALGVVVYIDENLTEAYKGTKGTVMAPWPVDVNGNKSDGTQNMVWAATTKINTTDTGISSVTTIDWALTKEDSCRYTDAIIGAGDADMFPAAWAARSYAPTTETKGKWCLPASKVLHVSGKHKDIIQESFSVLGGGSYPDCCVWSSVMYSSASFYTSYVWYSDLVDIYKIKTKLATKEALVYPVFEF